MGTTPQKLCCGSTHPQPTLLPATDEYFYRFKRGPNAGQLLHVCKDCRKARDRVRRPRPGYVPTAPLVRWIRELQRLTGGNVQAQHRLTGISIPLLYRWRNGELPKRMNKRTAEALLRGLWQLKHGDPQGTGTVVRTAPTAANTPVRRRNRRAISAEGTHVARTYGHNAYLNGCRCDVCRSMHAAWYRAGTLIRRIKRAHSALAGRDADGCDGRTAHA